MRFAVLLSALLLSGCVAVAVGVGTYGVIKYARNEASADYPTDLDATWQATVEALRGQGYSVPKGITHGPTEGKIEIANGWVKVWRQPYEVTRVTVRIGTFETRDNKRKMRLVLEDIGQRLDIKG